MIACPLTPKKVDYIKADTGEDLKREPRNRKSDPPRHFRIRSFIAPHRMKTNS